jgi:hypothetical protein
MVAPGLVRECDKGEDMLHNMFYIPQNAIYYYYYYYY